jgi:hypothetical protein
MKYRDLNYMIKINQNILQANAAPTPTVSPPPIKAGTIVL